jgi:hypothetical protein
MRIPLLAALALLTLVFDVERARAVRPFVTDDARTVGEGRAQLETWLLLDSLVLEHNVFAAIGPVEWLELSIGATHGGVHSGDESGYSFTGPIVQAKALVIAVKTAAGLDLRLQLECYRRSAVGLSSALAGEVSATSP